MPTLSALFGKRIIQLIYYNLTRMFCSCRWYWKSRKYVVYFCSVISYILIPFNSYINNVKSICIKQFPYCSLLDHEVNCGNININVTITYYINRPPGVCITVIVVLIDTAISWPCRNILNSYAHVQGEISPKLLEILKWVRQIYIP